MKATIKYEGGEITVTVPGRIIEVLFDEGKKPSVFDQVCDQVLAMYKQLYHRAPNMSRKDWTAIVWRAGSADILVYNYRFTEARLQEFCRRIAEAEPKDEPKRKGPFTLMIEQVADYYEQKQGRPPKLSYLEIGNILWPLYRSEPRLGMVSLKDDNLEELLSRILQTEVA